MAVRYRFVSFELDPAGRRLLRNGVTVPLQPKAFDLLVYLVERHGELLSKEQLLDEVWSGTFVTDNSLTRCAHLIRLALEDDPDAPRYLETVPRAGYRFIADVAADSASADQDAGLRRSRLLAVLLMPLVGVIALSWWWLQSPPEHSIAVLPFENRGSDPETEILAFGIRDDLNVHLGRVGQLKVIASSSVDKVDPSHPVDRIGTQLGVAYLLKGSIERFQDRIRLNVTLVRAADGKVAWSNSYDLELTTNALFQTRSSIARSIAHALRTQLSDEEEAGLDQELTDVLGALQAYQRGRYAVNKRTRFDLENAVSEFEQAIALDPNFAMAHAQLAITYTLLAKGYFGAGYGMLDHDEAAASAAPHVIHAMDLGPGLAQSHAAKGKLFGLQGDFDSAFESFRRATAINPSYADAYNWMSLGLGYRGRHVEAFEMLEEALHRHPLSIVMKMNYVDGLARRLRLDEAEEQLKQLSSICDWCVSTSRKMHMPPRDRWSDLILGHLELASVNNKEVEPANKLQWYLFSIGLAEEAYRIAGDEDPQILSSKDREEVLNWLHDNDITEETPDWFGFDGAYVFSYVGMFEEVRPILEEIWRRTASGYHFFSVSGPETYLMEALVAVRRDAGDEEGARKVLDFMQANVRRYREAGIVGTRWEDSVDYQEGVTLYLLGDRKQGLALMVKAAEDGYYMWPAAVFQDTMYREPEFVEILEKQAIRADRERKELLDVVCTDNPFAEVWQPMEVTCRDHAEAVSN